MSEKKHLVIVESPAKARTIGKYLGPEYDVKASVGHVRDLPERELGVDVEAGFEMCGDLFGVSVVDILGREALGNHRRRDDDLGAARRDPGICDGADQALAALRGRVGDDRSLGQNIPRFHRDQIRIARADAKAVKGSGHDFTPTY